MRYNIFIILLITLFNFSCQKENVAPSANLKLNLRDGIDEKFLESIDEFTNEFLFKVANNSQSYSTITYYLNNQSDSLLNVTLEFLEDNNIISVERYKQLCTNFQKNAIAITDTTLRKQLIAQRLNQLFLPVISYKSDVESNLSGGSPVQYSLPCTNELESAVTAISLEFLTCCALTDGTGAFLCGLVAGASIYSAYESYCTCLQTTYGNTGDGCN